MKRNGLFKRILVLGIVSAITAGIIGCGDSQSSGEQQAVTEKSSDSGTGQTDPDAAYTDSIINEENDVTADDTDDEMSTLTEDTTEDVSEYSVPTTADGVPILRDAVEAKLGGFVGCAVTASDIADEKVWEIVTTHFNAVTLGNELKPDALFNYSCTTCPGTQTVEFNGETMVVPKLYYGRAEGILDKILEWNEENPDREIKVRGHVLVWHSQTPEWFFHVDYDKSKPYVDKDTMNKRLEWYIATVLTHFTGEDSKYKDLFYGWDVVNEAISDSTGTYRSDAENANESLNEDRHGSNSSWWHVYQSNEFIINAFIYANKYAPEDLELYYNDYNECNVTKRTAIAKLLQEIKDLEGEPGVGTRISAMGMQGHYGMDSPGFAEIQGSIEIYGRIVGKVQFTEMDISASSDYDGSEEAKEEEYEKLRKRYSMIYFAINSANAEDGIEVSGITFWGTVDQYSWLQSRSNVGGGNTTGLPQCPLLFDENYEPKSCFYVFAGNN